MVSDSNLIVFYTHHPFYFFLFTSHLYCSPPKLHYISFLSICPQHSYSLSLVSHLLITSASLSSYVPLLKAKLYIKNIYSEHSFCNTVHQLSSCSLLSIYCILLKNYYHYV